MHHRKKRSQGGPWSPENIVAVCGNGTMGCHGVIESRPNEVEAQGFHVRPWQNPAEIPVLIRGQFRALLHPSEPRYIPINLVENDERHTET